MTPEEIVKLKEELNEEINKLIIKIGDSEDPTLKSVKEVLDLLVHKTDPKRFGWSASEIIEQYYNSNCY